MSTLPAWQLEWKIFWQVRSLRNKENNLSGHLWIKMSPHTQSSCPVSDLPECGPDTVRVCALNLAQDSLMLCRCLRARHLPYPRDALAKITHREGENTGAFTSGITIERFIMDKLRFRENEKTFYVYLIIWKEYTKKR